MEVRDLTQRTQALCRTLVKEHFPGEAPLFDPIWESLWRSLPSPRLEELCDPPRLGGDGAAVRVWQAGGHEPTVF